MIFTGHFHVQYTQTDMVRNYNLMIRTVIQKIKFSVHIRSEKCIALGGIGYKSLFSSERVTVVCWFIWFVQIIKLNSVFNAYAINKLSVIWVRGHYSLDRSQTQFSVGIRSHKNKQWSFLISGLEYEYTSVKCISWSILSERKY